MATSLSDAYRASENQEETNELELSDSFANLIPGEPDGMDAESITGDLHSISRTGQLTSYSVYALLVGSMIGSGIFSAPSEVDRNVPSPGLAILIWILSGLIAWTGAASFAELGAAIPKNGGMQEYLSYIYGDYLASVMGWLWVMAVNPASMAIISIIFGQYWTDMTISPESKSVWIEKLLAIIALCTIVAVNAMSTKNATRLTNLLLLIKLLAIVFVVAIAVLVIAFNLNSEGEGPSQDWKSRNWFASREKDVDGSTINWTSLNSWGFLGYCTSALYAGLWSYGGWDSVSSLKFNAIRQQAISLTIVSRQTSLLLNCGTHPAISAEVSILLFRLSS